MSVALAPIKADLDAEAAQWRSAGDVDHFATDFQVVSLNLPLRLTAQRAVPRQLLLHELSVERVKLVEARLHELVEAVAFRCAAEKVVDLSNLESPPIELFQFGLHISSKSEASRSGLLSRNLLKIITSRKGWSIAIFQ